MDKVLEIFKHKMLEVYRYRWIFERCLSRLVVQEENRTSPSIVEPQSYYAEISSLECSDDDHMAASCKVLLAGTLSKKLLSEVTEGVAKLKRDPLLVGFLSSTDPPARVYAEWTAKTAREK